MRRTPLGVRLLGDAALTLLRDTSKPAVTRAHVASAKGPEARADGTVRLRPYPYPYRAMLAIGSDLDSTPDRSAYWETMRFLNTTQATPLGRGLGLEVGNSIYFDVHPESFSYWNTDEAGRAMIRSLIRSGHIDCLHSFGERARSRADAQRALAELARHDCRLEVWVDHGSAVTDFGTDIMEGRGDVPEDEAYHADLTVGQGVCYVWRGRVTSVIGQETRARLGGLWTPRHPLASARTVAKEAAKHVLGRLGHAKYRMHGLNRLLRPVALRDGQEVYEFMRCDPDWAGVGARATAREMGEVLSEGMLSRLARRGGACILYTHLCKGREAEAPFGPQALAGFRRLAEAFGRGEILVTTTRRVLGYCRAAGEVSVAARRMGYELWVELSRPGRSGRPAVLSDRDLEGLSFYVPDPQRTRVTVDGREVSPLRRNPADHTGRESVSLPWQWLEFPA